MSSNHVTPVSAPARTLLTVNEVRAFLRVSRPQVYKLVRGGELRAVRVGARLRFRPEDIDRYLEGHLGRIP